MSETLRSGQTDGLVGIGFLTEAEAADADLMENFAKQLGERGDDPDTFIVFSVDFMTIAWKPSG